MAAGGLTRQRGTTGYRKRKPIPAIVLACLLGAAAVFVWVKIFGKASDINAEVACSPPSATSSVAAAAGQALAHDALDNVGPEPPSQVQVRVLNASNQRGQAQQVSTALTDLGFGQAADPTDDPLYPNGDMKCQGQIRFGANGAAAARTLSLVLPCTQLVRDNRQDTSVDLAIGRNFSTVAPNSDAVSALKQLSTWAAAHPQQRGGQQAQGGLAPQLSPALLSGARNMSC